MFCPPLGLAKWICMNSTPEPASVAATDPWIRTSPDVTSIESGEKENAFNEGGVTSDVVDTVTCAEPDWRSLVAVIKALPKATPLTTPLWLTVATAALLEDQVIDRSVKTFPFASFVVALAWVVPPTVMLDAPRF